MTSGRPAARKAALTLHVVSSVGWLGAVATYLGLAVVAWSVPDAAGAAPLYRSMQTLVWAVLLPFALASLLSGLLSSWVSPWGLFRHYWVTIKFGLNLLCTAVLAMYTQDIAATVEQVSPHSRPGMPGMDSAGVLPAEPVHLVHSAAALLILVLATGLAVYKPKGQIRPRQGRRPGMSAHEQSALEASAPTASGQPATDGAR